MSFDRDCLVVCTKFIRKIHDCPEMVKKYSFNKAEKPHEALSSLIPHFSSGFDTLLVLSRSAKILHDLQNVCNQRSWTHPLQSGDHLYEGLCSYSCITITILLHALQ